MFSYFLVLVQNNLDYLSQHFNLVLEPASIAYHSVLAAVLLANISPGCKVFPRTKPLTYFTLAMIRMIKGFMSLTIGFNVFILIFMFVTAF